LRAEDGESLGERKRVLMDRERDEGREMALKEKVKQRGVKRLRE